MGKSERRQQVAAWSGTRKDLQGVLNAIESLLAPVRQSEREKYEHDRDGLLVQYAAWIDEAEAWLKEHDDAADGYSGTRRSHEESLLRYRANVKELQDGVARRLADFDESWSIRLRITDKLGSNDETEPTAAGLAEKIDPRTFKSASVLAPVGHYGGAADYAIRVESGMFGISLNVTSPDPRFTKSAIAELREEMLKSRPWWFFLSNYYVNLAVLAIVFTVVLAVGLFHDEDEMNGPLLGVVSVVVGFGYASVAASIARWLMPPMSLLSDGGKRRGGAIIVWLVTLIASVPVGLFVNQWSAALAARQ